MNSRDELLHNTNIFPVVTLITDFLAKLRMNRFDPEYLPSFEGKLFFEGERKNKQIVNFIVLLALATVIATYGVVTDSTASVIGAMIIAP